MEELDRQKQAFESRWGVRIGKQVVVQLKYHSKPLTGRLEWLQDEQKSKNAVPHFRIGSLEFSHGEIEGIVSGPSSH